MKRIVLIMSIFAVLSLSFLTIEMYPMKKDCPVCLDENLRPNEYTTLECGHACCNDCLTTQIEMAINERKIDKTKCPAQGCPHNITIQEVRNITNNDNGTIQRLQSLIDSTPKTTTEYMRQKTRPCPACRFPIERSSGCDMIKCTKCDHRFCWNCLQSGEEIYHVNCTLPRAESQWGNALDNIEENNQQPRMMMQQPRKMMNHRMNQQPMIQQPRQMMMQQQPQRRNNQPRMMNHRMINQQQQQPMMQQPQQMMTQNLPTTMMQPMMQMMQ